MLTVTPQSVLVTGAGGFIGSRLVRHLTDHGDQVHCLVRSRPPANAAQPKGARIIVGDVTDRYSIAAALHQSRATAVFHLAGVLRARDEAAFARVNARGVDIVAAACAARPDPPVLIVVSSLAAAGPCNSESARVEEDPPLPVSNYGRSKLAGEQFATKYSGDMPITIVRPAIVFGPGDLATLAMFRPIARWGVHCVPRDDGCVRRVSLGCVDDCTEGLRLAALKGERLRPNGEAGRGIYYIAGPEQPTLAELGTLIAKSLGRSAPIVVRVPGAVLRLVGTVADSMTRLKGRPGWINSDKMTEAIAGPWICSSTKARTQLGWSTPESLDDRLRETADWYRGAGLV
ncbi:MAG: NAD-dependent epimerase/dehydratase family protein [Planctomycetes bacterium]|nr:NAD-dependent epimerase/dehydratase family protein [Planctomycetota bacterium]